MDINNQLEMLLMDWGFEKDLLKTLEKSGILEEFSFGTKNEIESLRSALESGRVSLIHDESKTSKKDQEGDKTHEESNDRPLIQILEDWGFASSVASANQFLSDNQNLELTNKKDRKQLKKFLKETNSEEENDDGIKTNIEETLSIQDFSHITDSGTNVPKQLVFGTRKTNANLGDFFPDSDGKVSSRMDKLLGRLTQLITNKPVYVEYGDYTNKSVEIKDANGAPKGSFDVSGSRTFAGGRLTGKGLNTIDPNYQGIASEIWGKSNGTLIRFAEAEWGSVLVDGELVEQPGRPKGYQGQFGVNSEETLVDPYDAVTDSETGTLLNARKLSNLLGEGSDGESANRSGVSNMHMAFGQYTDHNMSFLDRTATGQGLATEVDPNDLTDPLNNGFDGRPNVKKDDQGNLIPNQTGILGGRGEHYVVSSEGNLVRVAYFDKFTPEADGDATKQEILESGFYEFDENISAIGQPVLNRYGQEITGDDLVHMNKTESLIQNNQLYGATDAGNYLLRESARWSTEDGAFVYFTDSLGNEYKKEKTTENMLTVGDIVRGTIIKNGETYSIQNYGISTGLDKNGEVISELIKIDTGGKILDADILKTSHMLKSVSIGSDGLASLPNYADLLANNGVDTALMQAVFDAELGEQWFSRMGQTNPLFEAIQNDPNFIDFGNIDGYPLIGDISPRVFAGEINQGAMRSLDQNQDKIADVYAIEKIKSPYMPVYTFDGVKVEDLTANPQPKINSEDWGTGLLLTHKVGGDWRANENSGLTSLHTLWTREHTFQVDWITSTINEIKKTGEGLTEFNNQYGVNLETITTNDIANMARRMVEMEYQKILYEQFAPTLVGDKVKDGRHGWDGFNPEVDPSVAEEFSNAAYRFGHSQIQKEIIPGLDLFDAFLAPQVTDSYSISGILNGLSDLEAAKVDTKVNESVRSNLLANKLDLKSANIMRSRETGQTSTNALLRSLSGFEYNDRTGKYELQHDENGVMKEGYRPLNLANGSDVTKGILGPDGLYGTSDDTSGLDYGFVGNYGLRPIMSWEDFGDRMRGNNQVEKNDLLSSFMAAYDDSLEGSTINDKKISAAAKINLAQANPNNDTYSLGSNGIELVDVWNYMLAEKPSGEQLLGELAASIVWEQFDRFQDGDAHYYLTSLDGLGNGVWNHTLNPLEDIIARNTTNSTSDNLIDSGFDETFFNTRPIQANLRDAVTGNFEGPFNPSTINKVDYLHGLRPANQGSAPEISEGPHEGPMPNPYILADNNAIYEQVGAIYRNFATNWDANALDPWNQNNLFAHNTIASIDHNQRGEGIFLPLA